MAKRQIFTAESTDRDPYWYIDAVIYELHVRTFADSDADGVGDFRGLMRKLDYLQDLGVTALWLLPFYPSPLKDDGYDIADYTQVHPDYGTLRDFRKLVREAHKRGLRIITELVINHTSDQHPWFQRARKSPPGSRWRNYYVWSDTPDKYRGTRIIFKDFEPSNWSWDPVADAYYWHRFYAHQPDLNFDNPEVHDAVFKFLNFWMDMGVDGFRLDAVPYLYEREGTHCENLPETHEFLKKLRKHIDANYPDRMILAEANQWPEDAAAYFGQGDECHMNFHFPLMPRMFMSVRLEDRSPIIDILEQTPVIPDPCQWAVFLRNHDELTLEMVTDEERDYMYRVYAHDPQMRINLGIRRRLSPLLGNNRRTIELVNSLLFSLAGTPVLYYGDEIGMGDNIYLGDRNSVRTPMQWSADRNAGFSDANSQRLFLPTIIDSEYHYQSVNVEAQQANPSSLLWWMKRLIATRRRFKAFSRGSLEFLHPDNRSVLAYIRRYEDESILVVANLSRFSQFAELDLQEFKGMMPVEIFGNTEFPPIGNAPYLVTLAPHTFYWFDLHHEATRQVPAAIEPTETARESLSVAGSWDNVLTGRAKTKFLQILSRHLPKCRWFGGKSKSVRSVDIQLSVPVGTPPDQSYVLLLDVAYTDGEPETYLLPISYGGPEETEHLENTLPSQAIVAGLQAGDTGTGLLYDAVYNPAFCERLWRIMLDRRRLRCDGEELVGARYAPLKQMKLTSKETRPSVVRTEQSNSSIVFGDRFIVKLFRRVYAGTNPDLEITRFLTQRTRFRNVPEVCGSLELDRRRAEPRTLASVQRFVVNEGDAWTYTLDRLRMFTAEIMARGLDEPVPEPGALLSLSDSVDGLGSASETFGAYSVFARQIGRRTAEMHLALASDSEDAAFAPEPFTKFYQRSLYQSVRNQLAKHFGQLQAGLNDLPDRSRDLAARVLENQKSIDAYVRQTITQDIDALRIRCHGDYHLGQLLSTGTDLVIIDFEGEPLKTISERRIKRSPLQDVAGMCRSMQYAAYTALVEDERRGFASPDRWPTLKAWIGVWERKTIASFLEEYVATIGDSPLHPKDPALLLNLVRVFMIDKAIYELGYELDSRPDWVEIPLDGIVRLAEERHEQP